MFKKIIKAKILFWGIIGILSIVTSCKKETPSKDIAEKWETEIIVHQPFYKKELPKEFKNYWYAGEAEITSFKLEQARYGEI